MYGNPFLQGRMMLERNRSATYSIYPAAPSENLNVFTLKIGITNFSAHKSTHGIVLFSITS